jgi:hypothetical protein
MIGFYIRTDSSSRVEHVLHWLRDAAPASALASPSRIATDIVTSVIQRHIP